MKSMHAIVHVHSSHCSHINYINQLRYTTLPLFYSQLFEFNSRIVAKLCGDSL